MSAASREVASETSLSTSFSRIFPSHIQWQSSAARLDLRRPTFSSPFTSPTDRKQRKSTARQRQRDGAQGRAVPEAQKTVASLVCKQFSVLLVTSLNHSPTPLARLLLPGVSLAFEMRGVEIRSKMVIALQLEFFNRGVRKWEPVLEPCSIELDAEGSDGVFKVALCLAQRVEITFSDAVSRTNRGPVTPWPRGRVTT